MLSAVTGDFAYDHGMRWRLPLVAVLAACEPPGLTVEVTTSNTAVKTVEVLVGMDCAGDCPGRVAPPALAPRTVDRIFVVDDAEPWQATVEGGIAGFRITADAVSEVDMLLAIGLDAGGQPIETGYAYDVDVPLTRGDHVRVVLAPAVAVAASLTEPQPAGSEALAIWREHSAARACVLAEHWSDAPEPTRDLVVPLDDPDCDEVVNECAPWTPLAMNVPARIDDASCATFGPVGTRTDTCLFGGAPCNEVDVLPTGQCAPLDEPYCTPKQLCAACAGDWSPDCAFNALFAGVTATEPTIPSLACTFAIDDVTGKPCEDEAIVSGIDASVLLGASPVAECIAVAVHDLTSPLGPFQSSVQTEVGLFKLDLVSKPCTVDAHFKGILLPQESTSIVFVDLELDNAHHLAVPASIHMTKGCTQGPSCAFTVGTNSDPMLECARQAPSGSSACAPSGVCPYGPECGSGSPGGAITCCGSGEQCVNGQCTCGGGSACGAGDQCAGSVDVCGELCCGTTVGCPF
jgi:hypothetical protein